MSNSDAYEKATAPRVRFVLEGVRLGRGMQVLTRTVEGFEEWAEAALEQLTPEQRKTAVCRAYVMEEKLVGERKGIEWKKGK